MGYPRLRSLRQLGLSTYGYDQAGNYFCLDTGMYLRDDVNGRPVLPKNMVFQDGLIKDKTSQSMEKPWRHNRHALQTYVMYDPALGYQRKACGED